MSGVRRTVAGFVALGAATFTAQVVGFFVLAVLARRLGPEGIGSFSFAVNLAGYFAIPANFGITALAVRDVARDPSRVREVAGEVMVLQAALSIVPYALLVALAPVIAVDEDSRRMLWVVALPFLLDAFSISWVLLAHQRYGIGAVARVAGAFVYAGLSLALVRDAGDTLTLGWVHVAGIMATSLVSLAAVLATTGLPRLAIDVRRLVTRWRLGVPLGISAIMISVYYTADSIMLGYLRDTAEVGQYAVAYRVPLAILTFAGLWGSVLFPQLSAVAGRSRTEVREQLGWFSGLSLVASFPLLAGAVIVGPALVPQLFGAQYEPAGTPFVVLMGAAALVVYTVTYGTTEIALGDERHYAIAVTTGAVTNVLANFVAIPLWGMTGAAAATVLAEVVVFVYVAARVHRLLGRPPFERERVMRSLFATAGMVTVLLVLPGSLSPAAHVAVGVVVFVVLALPLRVVRPAELRALVPR